MKLLLSEKTKRKVSKISLTQAKIRVPQSISPSCLPACSVLPVVSVTAQKNKKKKFSAKHEDEAPELKSFEQILQEEVVIMTTQQLQSNQSAQKLSFHVRLQVTSVWELITRDKSSRSACAQLSNLFSEVERTAASHPHLREHCSVIRRAGRGVRLIRNIDLFRVYRALFRCSDWAFVSTSSVIIVSKIEWKKGGYLLCPQISISVDEITIPRTFDHPSITSANARKPSRFPARKFCSVCGTCLYCASAIDWLLLHLALLCNLFCNAMLRPLW